MDEEEDLEKYFLSMQKLLNISKIKELGWKPNIDLKDSIHRVCKWYLKGTK